MRSKPAIVIPFPCPAQRFEPTVHEGQHIVDRDGTHYAAFPGITVVKSRENDDSRGVLIVQKTIRLAEEETSGSSREHVLPALVLTPNGYLLVRGRFLLALLDRDLNTKSVLLLQKEEVLGSLCKSERDIFVVTSRRLLKLVWTGSKFSFEESDGGWESLNPPAEPAWEIRVMPKKRRPFLRPASQREQKRGFF
jgi:hypothetical protein